ncbi:MAG: protease modulator HflK [Nevskia sp.]|nr:protease modulator HflK [Nevskia sp.]
MNADASAAPASPWLEAGRLAFVALYAVTLLAALGWVLSNVRRVDPQNRVVVQRLGALARVRGAGLLLAWPRPFEQVLLLPSAETVLERHVETLLRAREAIQTDVSPDDDDSASLGDALAGSGYLLTGDAGVVQLDVRVFYKVTDPYDYVLQREHLLPALDRLVTRSAVAVCAARDLDAILVARPELVGTDGGVAERRERLRGDLVRQVNRRLADLQAARAGLGIEVVRADVQSSLPRDAVNAFNAVLTASQAADRDIAEARTEAARLTQSATQAADRSLEVANAQASERLARAQADTAEVQHLAQSVRDRVDPGLLLRVYRERMPAILAKVGSVTLVDPRDDAHLIIQGAEK